MEISTNVLKYWEKMKSSEPYLYKLAQIVMAVPASQVSVERCFSALKFILSDHRYNLSDESVKNVLLVRLNHTF